MRPASIYNTMVKGPLRLRTKTISDPDPPWIDTEYDLKYLRMVKPASIPTDPAVKPRPMTNWSSFSLVQIVGPSAFYRRVSPGPTVFEADGSGPYVVMEEVEIPTLPTWMVDSALNKALNKLRSGDLDLGVALAEAKETAGLLSGTTRRIAKQVDNFRRKNPKKLWDSVKKGRNIPSSWLELQYGWTPLMSDIVGSMKAADDAWLDLGDNAGLIRVSARVKENTLTQVAPFETFGTYVMGSIASHELMAECVLYYTLADPMIVLFNSLGLLDPAAIAWEKIPYSFVVDWFLPVGDWLGARSADWGWTFVQGCESQFTRTTAVAAGTLSHSWSNAGTSYEARVRELPRMRGHRFHRSTFGDSPQGRLVLQNPLTSSGSLSRALSGIALLSQAFR